MYNEIVVLMDERVITAADWQPYVNQTGFLTVERDWMSDHWLMRNPHGNVLTDVVTKFTVYRIGNTQVMVLVDLGDPLVEHGTLMSFDADELALRFEDA